MIIDYRRPSTLEEALLLLSTKEIKTVPLGGGTALNRPSTERFIAVDLQALGLNVFEKRGSILTLGATVTLQSLLDSGEIPSGLQDAICQEAGYNLRQAATVAGTLVAADGRSPFTTVLLALDTTLEIQSASAGTERLSLGDFLPLRGERMAGRLITSLLLPLNARLGYEVVARTPVDLPIVCAALAQWPSGRTRLVLGGFGGAPVLALDGPEPGGLEQAARDAYSRAGDEWASAEYRQAMAATLARRCLLSVAS